MKRRSRLSSRHFKVIRTTRMSTSRGMSSRSAYVDYQLRCSRAQEFHSYAEFMTISKEISTLENDMLELKESLSEWKSMPSLLHIDDSVSAIGMFADHVISLCSVLLQTAGARNAPPLLISASSTRRRCRSCTPKSKARPSSCRRRLGGTL